MTLFIFCFFKLHKILLNLIGSIVVLDKSIFNFFALTPKVPIEATFLLFKYNI